EPGSATRAARQALRGEGHEADAAQGGDARTRALHGAHRAVGASPEHHAAYDSHAQRGTGLVRRRHGGERVRAQARPGAGQGWSRRRGGAAVAQAAVAPRLRTILRIAGYAAFYVVALIT